MLVYVRDSDYNDVMPASSQESIPPELVQRFAAELVQEEEEAAEAARLRSLMRVRSQGELTGVPVTWDLPQHSP